MLQTRGYAILILIAGMALGWWVYASQISGSNPFKLGLDLEGGTHIVFKADVSHLASTADIKDSMQSLRDTIERRVNLFGVSEPVVYTEQGSTIAGNGEQRLVVELPGVTDTQQAVAMIGKTPVLDFRLLKENATTTGASAYEPTKLTGRYLSHAQLQFGGQQGGLSNQPVVALVFTGEGGQLFQDITTKNVGRTMGIFLDGQPISTPVITEPISGGSAIITGSFTPDQAKELVRNLNFGALPVPISLESTQTIGSALGARAVQQGVMAGFFGILAVSIFMLLWYRLPGLVAVFGLSVYIVLMLASFKLIPVVLTAAGVAGFILSLGMAVDANVLIFERMKEELAEGRSTHEAIKEGFSRAWPAIRDGNMTSIITAIILFWFGSSLIKGFALVFGIGVLASMLSAITASRLFLLSIAADRRNKILRFLFGSGISI